MQTKFSEPAVLNWDSVIHKGVRTADGEPLGYIAADDEEAILVLSSRFREYRVPKTHVRSFDGSLVLLDIGFGRMEEYRIC
ncbi:MAG TPA: hypothetical protein VGQ03_03005 [Nitrososphaera sp.]|jgi:hypothetical protein|nr:hypothetical protein [Nitrososphaera sp.]